MEESITSQTEASIPLPFNQVAAKTPEFSYENLCVYIESGKKEDLAASEYNYEARADGTFIQFCLMQVSEPKASQEGGIFKKFGLKFHISLPENDKAKYKLGWDIVRNTLFEYGVGAFKIVQPGLKMSDAKDKGQRGKDITIYADNNAEKTVVEWQYILTVVTQRLVDAKVPPGYRVPGTTTREEYIRGSNYISYRYFDERTKKSKWPPTDYCQNIFINVPGQQEPATWNIEVPKSTSEKKPRPTILDSNIFKPPK